ncbi:DUF58 domain-containing protein [Pseudoxanthomonas winnipegensis]|jgi:uncharacterized protein (DUF58 family)|uniref:DUF58 domain-containing protein n=1 Tax=Pseudoxanthomonas winnipegensis TaxID=2480810 RepID=A0ABY1WB02_9GAMM|nr:DUF58 domain-containing protein [Pseudoxanthomonas winnipegensis]TAA07658.1 DUF58 domain-containing protein [Pseudoxanthomonas winnipegensis]TAA17683.1 DUF58 domain-containing protein [Pseudoxanthomonas winnipegensis]TAH71403.1 DUF58 domain-containing protein [Pseudoxanthomonas winnipegensis]
MRPAAPLIALLCAWGISGLAVLFAELPLTAWKGIGMAIAGVALLDALALWRRPAPQVQRRVPEALALDLPREVQLTLASPGRTQRVEVFDLHPGAWPSQGLPRALRLARDATATFAYTLRPIARGDAWFAGVQLRLASPLRLWKQARVVGAPQAVRVYPDFAPLARLALFSADQASRLVGAHLKRRRGEGTDFNQMREYRVGDSLRQIDWKATSRAGKLISREYQDEKNQQLVLVLDTGRRMLAREDGLAHFDHALNAALVVAYLALRQGDAAGLLSTGEQPRWVPPRRGMAGIDTLLRAAYDLQPSATACDYLAMASELSARQRRRALVMLVTNVRDEDIEDLLAAVHLLRRRHLVCVASLREAELDRALEAEVTDLSGAIQAGALARYLDQRAAAHDALRGHGVMVLDVTTAQLPGALVERYLAVKREGLL